MSSEVFGGSTHRDGRFKDLKTDLGPFTDRFQLDTTGYESLRKISTTCSEGVGSDRYGSWGFVGFKERESFVHREESHELVDKEVVVSEIGSNIMFQLEQVVGTRSRVM